MVRDLMLLLRRTGSCILGVCVAACLPGCSLLFERDPAGSGADAATGEGADASGETPFCFGQMADFENADVGPLAIYEGLEFRGSWDVYAAGAFSNPSRAVAFSTERASGRIDFTNAPRQLLSARVYWSEVPINVTLTNMIDSITVSLDASHPSELVQLGWGPSTSIFVESDQNWLFFLDDLCHEPVLSVAGP